MTQLQYLQIFADKEELLDPFDDAERGRLFTAMLRYALHCEETVLTGNERFIWPVFKQMIDQSRESLDNKRKAGIARQQAAAESSSAQQTAAQASTSQQTAAEGHIKQESRIKNHESSIMNHELRNMNHNEGEEKRARAARFSPPDAAEVAAFAQAHGLSINAGQFVDFYTAKGWRVGNSPMKDWRAAVRNWVRRDQSANAPPDRRVSAQMYTQRAYTEAELTNDTTQELLAEAENAVNGGTYGSK